MLSCGGQVAAFARLFWVALALVACAGLCGLGGNWYRWWREGEVVCARFERFFAHAVVCAFAEPAVLGDGVGAAAEAGEVDL